VFEPSSYAVKYAGRPLLAVDIETTGLDPRKDRILGISFCNAPNNAVAVPWPVVQDSMYAVISSILESELIYTCFQNGLFDLEFLAVNGMDVSNYKFDTRYAHHCTLPEGSRYLKPHSLRFMNALYTNLPSYKSEYT
jgi:DNA polymerase I-like protein with 3'-5' exonuclease and polymerase domains